MITYEVQYKKIGSLFYKKLKKVKGDGFLEDNIIQDVAGIRTTNFKNARWFILEDETRIEIPLLNHIFVFAKERFYSIKDRMEVENGIDLKLNKG